ncbi:MAG: hypothetical protein AAGU05_11200, partial [Anaerolineaceae bacterium]
IRQYYPLTAIEWMQSHLPPVRVVNEYNWGGFLLWQWPESEVFIDGRTDLYGDTVMGEWMEIMQCGEETAQILDRWDAEALLVEPGRPVSTCLLQNGWENVYQDEQAVILVRDAGLLR